MTPAAAREALWHAGVLRWKLWPQQHKIYDVVRRLPISVQTFVCLCARQFGKSVLLCALATEDCQQNPDVVVLIVAPTIKQARAIVRPRMRLLLKDCPDGLVRFVKSEDTWYFANGSELKLGGFDTNPASQRGKTLYKIYLEEIGVDSDPDLYTDFIRSDLAPALTHSKHAQIGYFTTPPKIPDHPFLLETVREAIRAGAYFEFTIDDNEKLTPEQRAACIRLAGGVHTTEYQREYLCKTVRDGRIVLVPEFEDAPPFVEAFELPPYYHAWVAGDTGGVQDRTVFLLMAYDFERAKILVIDEREFPPEVASSVYVPEALAMEAGHGNCPRFVDAAAQHILDLAAIHKYPVILPRKDELEATVNQVRKAARLGEFVVHPRCQFLRLTLRSGTFNERRTDLARTKTLGHMDAFMALAYGLRHPNKGNPFPDLYGLHHETHHIPERVRLERTARELGAAMTARRRS